MLAPCTLLKLLMRMVSVDFLLVVSSNRPYLYVSEYFVPENHHPLHGNLRQTGQRTRGLIRWSFEFLFSLF